MDLDFTSKIVLPIFTFFAGFIVSRFTFSAKEKHDIESQKLKTSTDLSIEQDKAYQAFVAALQKYISKPDPPTIDDFFSLATSGEAYFSRLRSTCDAIIAQRVDLNSIRNTHKPMVAQTVNKLLPEFYKSLQDIARKNKFSYTGVLQRSNYLSIYEVNETTY